MQNSLLFLIIGFILTLLFGVLNLMRSLDYYSKKEEVDIKVKIMYIALSISLLLKLPYLYNKSILVFFFILLTFILTFSSAIFYNL